MGNRDEIVAELGFGIVPRVFDRAAGNLDVETALWTAFRHVVLRGLIPRTVKEMMGVLISLEAGSVYASEIHLHALAVQDVEGPILAALRDHRVPEGIPTQLAALLTFAQAAAERPGDAASVGILTDAGLSDAEIIEAVAVVGLFRMVNAWTDLLAIPVDDL